MRCPYCQTENRDDREKCYHCGKDLSMLRLIVNRAKNHYNRALEQAERGHLVEAVAELDSALQLHSNFPEARLLLGTLYARLEQPEEARTQWEHVLQTDPNAERAHTYLGDVGDLKRVLPMKRRIGLLVSASVTLALIAVLVLTVSSWPSATGEQIGRAWAAFAGGDLGLALQLVEDTPRPIQDRELVQSVQHLEEAIRGVIDSHLDAIKVMYASGDYEGTLAAIAEFEAKNPPSGSLQAAREYRSLVQTALEEEIRTALSREYTAENRAQLDTAASEVLEWFPTSEIAESAVRRFDQRGEDQLRAVLEELDALIERGAGEDTIRERFVEAERLASLTGEPDALGPRTHRLLLKRQLGLLEEAEEHIAADRLEAAKAILTELSPDTAAPELESRIEELNQGISRKQEARKLEEALAMAERGDMLKALRATRLLDEDLLDARQIAQKKELVAELSQDARSHATNEYHRLMRMGEQFDEGNVSKETATAFLELEPLIWSNLSAIDRREAYSDFVFFRAVSHRALGENEEAMEAIDELREQRPADPYLITWEKLQSANPPANTGEKASAAARRDMETKSAGAERRDG